MHVWDEFSEFLPENRVPTSVDFNTYPIRIFFTQLYLLSLKFKCKNSFFLLISLLVIVYKSRRQKPLATSRNCFSFYLRGLPEFFEIFDPPPLPALSSILLNKLI